MKRTVTIAAGALAIILVGCGGTVATPNASFVADSAPSAAPITTPTTLPSPPTAVPSPLPTPSATPDPEAVRKTAAAAYLEAANTANKSRLALNKKYPKTTTLQRERAYFKGRAKIDGDFVAAVKRIVVPADAAGDIHTLIARYTASQALWIEGSGTKSWTHLNGLTRDLTKALRAATGAANLVRSDLGLPPVSAR